MEPYIDDIIIYVNEDRAKQLQRNLHHEEWCGTFTFHMKFKDGVAIEVDEDGDVPLFDDPVVLTYPSLHDYQHNPQMQEELETYIGPERAKEPIPFDIALKYGIPHLLSEIVKH